MYPKDVEKLLSHMKERGISAFVVGGAVRDMIMKREPGDYDIAAECTPDELLAAFEGYQYFDTGIRFGTLNVFSGERYTEITCCRYESGYTDLRRPDCVEFCRDIKKDLARRDFTVNAIAMDLEGNIIDPFGGREDIEKRIVRCVGDPRVRFPEDALRIIRALRFASALGFEIEKDTSDAVKKMGHLLSSVSGERIFVELKKLLLGEKVFEVLMEYSGVICEIIPELSASVGHDQKNPYHIYTVYEHIARSVAACPADVDIRLCMLFHDIGKPETFFTDEKGIGHFYGHPAVSCKMAEKILKRLKADNKTVEHVCFLVEYHDVRPALTKKSIHKYITKTGFKGARELLEVRRADVAAQSPELLYRFEELSAVSEMIDELEGEGACTKISDLAVNGNDLIEIGYEKGKLIGETLSYLLKKVVSGETENERESLLRLAKRKSEK